MRNNRNGANPGGELEEMYTVAEVAALTKSSEAKWRKKISRREIPIIKLGRQVRIPKSYVNKMLADGFQAAARV